MHYTPSDVILEWRRAKQWREFLPALLLLSVLLAILAARIAYLLNS